MGRLEPNYSDETVVVTGATSGIGREIAIQFAEAGANVIIGDIVREPKDADEPTAELIENNGGVSKFVRTNVGKRSDVKDLVDSSNEYGGVDIMINNAGVFREGDVTQDLNDNLDDVFDVNAKGVYYGTHFAAKQMIENDKTGTILNTASISSEYAQKGQSKYDATKGAIRMITRSTALELSDYDIRVNAVAPGQIATEFVEGLTEEQKRKAKNKEHFKPIPLGRAGDPEDVAGAYLFLASEMASYITGELLYVDGGWQIA